MMEENEGKKKTPKYRFTTKTFLYLGGLGGLLGFIVLSAVWDLTFGQFDVVNFVADTLILTAICIFTLVLMELFSEESNKNKTLGVYNLACNEYIKAMASIEGIRIYFSQWYYWFMERETKKKRETYLSLCGIKGTDAKKIVKYATLDDIPRMEECRKCFVKELDDGKKVVLPKLETKEQSKMVEEVLTGKHDIVDGGYAEYLFLDDIGEATMSIIERKDYLKKRREQSKKRANILAVIRLVATSLLLAVLVPANPEESTANKWWIFAKRIGVFGTSLITGWFAGSNDVVASAALVTDKTNMINEFKKYSDSGEWKPKTEEELDAEIIAEYEKEQEEARASVIDPVVEVSPTTALVLKGGD